MKFTNKFAPIKRKFWKNKIFPERNPLICTENVRYELKSRKPQNNLKTESGSSSGLGLSI